MESSQSEHGNQNQEAGALPDTPSPPQQDRLRDYRLHMRRIDPRIHSKPPTYHISHVAYRQLRSDLKFECNVTCVKCKGVTTVEISVNKEDEYKEPQIRQVPDA